MESLTQHLNCAIKTVLVSTPLWSMRIQLFQKKSLPILNERMIASQHPSFSHIYYHICLPLPDFVSLHLTHSLTLSIYSSALPWPVDPPSGSWQTWSPWHSAERLLLWPGPASAYQWTSAPGEIAPGPVGTQSWPSAFLLWLCWYLRCSPTALDSLSSWNRDVKALIRTWNWQNVFFVHFPDIPEL